MQFFTYLGFVTAALLAVVLLLFVRELIWLLYRAALQTRRIVRAHRDQGGKRWPVRGTIGFYFREIFSTYTTVRIGNVELPYDPREPTEQFWGAGT